MTPSLICLMLSCVTEVSLSIAHGDARGLHFGTIVCSLMVALGIHDRHVASVVDAMNCGVALWIPVDDHCELGFFVFFSLSLDSEFHGNLEGKL